MPFYMHQSNSLQFFSGFCFNFFVHDFWSMVDGANFGNFTLWYPANKSLMASKAHWYVWHTTCIIFDRLLVAASGPICQFPSYTGCCDEFPNDGVGCENILSQSEMTWCNFQLMQSVTMPFLIGENRLIFVI